MGKNEKLLQLILSGNSDNNINFNDLIRLLENLGFNFRIKGVIIFFIKKMLLKSLIFNPKA
jgi:hypothetical protein